MGLFGASTLVSSARFAHEATAPIRPGTDAAGARAASPKPTREAVSASSRGRLFSSRHSALGARSADAAQEQHLRPHLRGGRWRTDTKALRGQPTTNPARLTTSKLGGSRGFAMADNVLVFYGSYRADADRHPLANFVTRSFAPAAALAELIDAREVGLPMLDRMYKEYPKGEPRRRRWRRWPGRSARRTPSCS